MSENESSTSNTDTLAADEKVEIEAGSWQETLQKSALLKEKAGKADAKAGEMLWTGAQEGIEAWLPDSDTDVSAESLRADIINALGKARKGDASKIVTVALAVKNNGLILSLYPNLSKAWGEATRLTKTVKVQQTEDDAAEKAVAEIAASAPKSSSSPEGAAKIVLAQGMDEFARLIVNALCGEGPQSDLGAARSALRALTQEIAGRVPAPVKVAKVATPKGKATKTTGASPKAAVKTAGAKAKPVKKAAPVKAAPVEDESVAVDQPAPVVRTKAKAKPVVRRGRPTAS